MNNDGSTTISIPTLPIINSEHQLENQEPKFPPTAYVLNQSNYVQPNSTNLDLDLERQDQSDEPKQDRLMRLRGGCCCCDCLYDLIRCLLCCCIFEAICDMCC